VIKFLHAADLHLDSPFHGLKQAEAAARRKEHRQLLTTLAELADEESCDLMLLSGDLFDSTDMYQETVETLIRALGSCRARVFLSPGNHDWLCPGSPYLTAVWPDNVHIFRRQEMEFVDLPELNCRVYGAGFTAPHAPSLLRGFRVKDRDKTNLMVLHGDATTADSPYNAVAKEDVAESGLDYLALGHIHAGSGALTAGSTCYAWPGCPMGRGFDEAGPKGVYLGTIRDHRCDLRFRELPGKRYEELSVTAGDDPLAAIQAALTEDTSQWICRLRLTGPAERVDVPALHRALDERFYALTIRDETEPKADLWAAAGEDSLRGKYLSLLRSAVDEAGPDQRQALLLAARLGIDAMDGREEAVDL